MGRHHSHEDPIDRVKRLKSELELTTREKHNPSGV